jgi:hypothetical protein
MKKITLESRKKIIAWGLAGFIFIIVLGSLTEWFLETKLGQVTGMIILIGIIIVVFWKVIIPDIKKRI